MVVNGDQDEQKLRCNGQFRRDVKNNILHTKCDSKQTVTMLVF